MLPPGTPVDVYCRVSTEDQALLGSSLDAQAEAGRAVCARLGLAVANVVVDGGLSSKDLNRPGIQEILGRLGSGEVRGVVVAAVDRLTRRLRDADLLVDRHFSDPAGSWLIADGAYVDTRSATGRMLFFILVTVSQYQREVGAEKTRSTLSHKRGKGELLGRDRFGYRIDPTNPARSKKNNPLGLVPDLNDAEVRRLVAAFRKEIPPRSLRWIAAALNQTNHKPKRGPKWSPSTVAKILKGAASDA